MVACWRDDAAPHLLGALLPDLATMAGARGVQIDHPTIEAGVRLHHEADAVFHADPLFIGLCSTGRAELQALGVRRATALGAAHVGIELLLDGAWIEDKALLAATRAALDLGTRTPALRWPKNSGARPRFVEVCRRFGAPDALTGYRDAAEVGRRLARILGRHHRLAPRPDDLAPLRAWVQQSQPGVLAAAPPLAQSLRTHWPVIPDDAAPPVR